MRVDALASTVTDGIVTIVAQCNISNTPLRKMLHVANIVFYGKTILNAKHDTLFSLSLVFIELFRMTSKCKVLVICFYNFFYLVKDKVSVCLRSFNLKRCDVCKCLSGHGLRQVSHHGHSILVSFRHFVQVYKDTTVTLLKVYALWKKHRRVAV